MNRQLKSVWTVSGHNKGMFKSPNLLFLNWLHYHRSKISQTEWHAMSVDILKLLNVIVNLELPLYQNKLLRWTKAKQTNKTHKEEKIPSKASSSSHQILCLRCHSRSIFLFFSSTPIIPSLYNRSPHLNFLIKFPFFFETLSAPFPLNPRNLSS